MLPIGNPKGSPITINMPSQEKFVHWSNRACKRLQICPKVATCNHAWEEGAVLIGCGINMQIVSYSTTQTLNKSPLQRTINVISPHCFRTIVIRNETWRLLRAAQTKVKAMPPSLRVPEQTPVVPQHQKVKVVPIKLSPVRLPCQQHQTVKVVPIKLSSVRFHFICFLVGI